MLRSTAVWGRISRSPVTHAVASCILDGEGGVALDGGGGTATSFMSSLAFPSSLGFSLSFFPF